MRQYGLSSLQISNPTQKPVQRDSLSCYRRSGRQTWLSRLARFGNFSSLKRKRIPGTKESSTIVQTPGLCVCVCVCVRAVWPRAAVPWPRYQDYTKMHVAAASADLFPTKTSHFSTVVTIVLSWLHMLGNAQWLPYVPPSSPCSLFQQQVLVHKTS